MNYIITKHPEFFHKIIPEELNITKTISFCNLEDMILPDKIALDTETTGLIPRHEKLFCVQIGTGENNYIIHLYDDNYNFKDLPPYINDKIIVGHNILFDLGFMYHQGFFPKEVRDTFLASKILYNGEVEAPHFIPYKHDFGSVMKRELGFIYDKTDQKNIHLVKLSQKSTIQYSFNDVDKLLTLEQNLYDKLNKRGSTATYLLHCRYIKALAYMEQCGMPISSNKWKAKMATDIMNSLKWKQNIEEYIFDKLPTYRDLQIDMFEESKRITVSLTSSKQMLPVFNKFGIDTKDKDGKDSIEENIISKSKHEFVEMWLKFQESNHRVTTFGEKLFNKIENERIYTNFNPMVDTARLSTRKGQINFLNFPSDEETRNSFVANKGNKMIVCDWSGQETVIAADLSGDDAMTHSVNTGACLHCAFARILFPELVGLDDETITKKHKSKRQAAKSPRFAFQYGGSAYTIHQNEGIPLDEAYKIENAFKELHAGLYIWGALELEKALKTGYIVSADGWRLKLPKFDFYKKKEQLIKNFSQEDWKRYKEGKLEHLEKEKNLEKKLPYKIINQESYNFYMSKKVEVSIFFKLKSSYQRLCLNNPVQSRGSHQLKLATCLFFEWIIKNNLQWIVLLCNTIHDEIVVEVPEYLAEQTRLKVQESMLIGGDNYLINLKIKADANIGESWGEAK
jgi:DNA polymerase I-like protein with 3'-5' exonuclease and polymerase domains